MSNLRRRLTRVGPVLIARLQLHGCKIGYGVATFGRVRVIAVGGIRIGARTTFAQGLTATALIAHTGSQIDIGASCMLNAGSRIEAHDHVSIGNRVLIAGAVTLVDDYGKPIVLEDDVWIAHGVVVKPGVRIGRNSVVSAGSVVEQDVPPGSLAVGTPARAVPLSTVAPR